MKKIGCWLAAPDIVFIEIAADLGYGTLVLDAEHGIGLLKKAYLDYSRTPEEIALMKTLRHAMDPKGILNPGKIFEG